MLSGAAGMTLALAASGAAGALYGLHWPGLLTAWLLIGAGYSATVTPAGHPHIAAGPRHSHAYVIDTLHRRWPHDREMARGV